MENGRVVFLIMSHHNLRLVERLLRRLVVTQDAVTVVHHDAKTTTLPELPASDRIMFVPERSVCGWGDIAFTKATLRCVRWITEQVPDFSWIVLLSGQDYPAKSPRRIEEELLASKADAFIHWEAVPPISSHRSSDWQRGMSKRYYWHYLPGTHRSIPLPRLRFMLGGVVLLAGATWWNLGRRAVERILSNPELTDYLVQRLRSTIVIDEAFFQTALLNSAGGLDIVNNHRRFYRFSKAGGAAHPDVLTIRDADAILASDAFFVRKVDEEASAELLDRLDEESRFQAGP